MTFGVHLDYWPFRRLGDLTIDAEAVASLVHLVHLHKTAPGNGRTLCTLHVRRDEFTELVRNLPPIWAWTLLPRGRDTSTGAHGTI